MSVSGAFPHIPIVFENHKSSLLDPSFISSYIATEQAAGRYSDAFAPEELENIIGPFRTSPLGLVPKPPSTFRLIQDMSYPRNHHQLLSVNANIDSDDFPTTWGTFDIACALILSLPAGCTAATFDISAAYRLTPIRPEQQNMLCVFWEGCVYVDRAVMFGLTSSAGVFGCIADTLVAIYAAAGFHLVIKWVDDFFVVRPPDEHWTEEDFMALTAYFGVPWSGSKLRRFASTQRYIGFDWDLVSRSVALPQEKLSKISTLVDEWMSEGKVFSARDAASLHGRLVHISCIFRLIRPFLRSVSRFANSFESARAKLHVSSSMRADLSWIAFLLHHSPNNVPLRPPTPVDLGWWGDASTSFGIGIVIGRHWAVWQWAPGFRVGPNLDFDIGWAEAVAVELGFRLAVELGLISSSADRGQVFLVRSDNSGVVHVVNKGRSRNRETNRILKHIYLLQASHSVQVTTTYVPSRANISDALSRGDIDSFLHGFPAVSVEMSIPLPGHLLDKLVPSSRQRGP